LLPNLERILLQNLEKIYSPLDKIMHASVFIIVVYKSIRE